MIKNKPSSSWIDHGTFTKESGQTAGLRAQKFKNSNFFIQVPNLPKRRASWSESHCHFTKIKKKEVSQHRRGRARFTYNWGKRPAAYSLPAKESQPTFTFVDYVKLGKKIAQVHYVYNGILWEVLGLRKYGDFERPTHLSAKFKRV